jgi:tRNA (cmo5U34)-methyltransferase
MSTEKTDTGYAPDKWEFDEEVSRVFDDMLARSIPQYETMREAVTLVASAFLSRYPRVVDIGCSRGEALDSIRALVPPADGQFTGLEISEPMIAAAMERFSVDGRVKILEHDLRKTLPLHEGTTDVVLSVLTMMFVPVNYRMRLLRDVYRALRRGGALVLVEKVMGEGPDSDDLFTANYHRKKADSGYTPDEIQRKRLSLEGVLVPMTPSWNEHMLRRTGFRDVDCFWRWMNFAGWVAIK